MVHLTVVMTHGLWSRGWSAAQFLPRRFRRQPLLRWAKPAVGNPPGCGDPSLGGSSRPRKGGLLDEVAVDGRARATGCLTYAGLQPNHIRSGPPLPLGSGGVMNSSTAPWVFVTHSNGGGNGARCSHTTHTTHTQYTEHTTWAAHLSSLAAYLAISGRTLPCYGRVGLSMVRSAQRCPDKLLWCYGGGLC
jgi:hypothetical protein